MEAKVTIKTKTKTMPVQNFFRYISFQTTVSLHFQIEKKVLLENGTHVESVEIKFGLINTKLRSNPAYVHGYSLIGSTIIMVVIPGMYR